MRLCQYPLIFRIILGPSLQNSLLRCSHGDVLFPSVLLHLLFGICEGSFVPSPHLFIFQSLIYICVFSWVFIFFSGLLSNSLLIYFVAQHIPALATWRLAPCELSKCPNCYISVLFFRSIFLISGTTRCFKLILYFLCPCPRTSHFSRELWFHLLEIGI